MSNSMAQALQAAGIARNCQQAAGVAADTGFQTLAVLSVGDSLYDADGAVAGRVVQVAKTSVAIRLRNAPSNTPPFYLSRRTLPAHVTDYRFSAGLALRLGLAPVPFTIYFNPPRCR